MIATRFPRWSRDGLEKAARRHRPEVDFAYGHEPSDIDNVDRLVVNMLRHGFSDYDQDQSRDAHRFVCQAIKERFAWLADECDRQIERRARAEDLESAFLSVALEQIKLEHERRTERSRLSSEVIGDFNVGDQVIARIAGRDRGGTITWIGRKRVEVVSYLKTGECRTRLLFVSDLRELSKGF